MVSLMYRLISLKIVINIKQSAKVHFLFENTFSKPMINNG